MRHGRILWQIDSDVLILIISINIVLSTYILKLIHNAKGVRKTMHSEQHQKTIFEMSSQEFELSCKNAVANRNNNNGAPEYVTRLDPKSHEIKKVFRDGHEEIVV